MRYFPPKLLAGCIGLLLLGKSGIVAQNPVIRDQFTADPSARVFDDRVYLYPSHDIVAAKGRGREGWFCMEDYHVFSSSDLIHWTDHGVIVSQNKVKWVDSTKYSMWSPDCFSRNGKYYFYFPSLAKDTIYGRGFSIGVSVSDQPAGSFTSEHEPIKNVHGIDPNVFIDNDGQAYLYWSARNIYVAKLKENMLELDSDPQIINNLPEEGLKEGPYVFERNGKYYLTYPHVDNKTERLEYAISDNPMGPFRVSGVIMDELPGGCWTNHQSIILFREQWYLFYHNNDLSPKFDKNRSVRIDSLFFNDDGTIQKVIPKLRGVGVSPASQKIEIDRFSRKSETGCTVVFLDTLNTFNGWKTILDKKDAWIQYNTVEFGIAKNKKVEVKVSAKTGGTLCVRLDNADGPILSEIKVPASEDWITVTSRVSRYEEGIHNLVIVLKTDEPVEIDWIRFIIN